MTLRAGGPEYVPLRTFRDDDLLDPGSDPLIALMGALSELEEGERVLCRLLLRSLGPDWSQSHQARAHRQAVPDNREPSYTYQTKPLQLDGVTMAVLGAGALAALKGYLWVQDGEILKASLLAAGSGARSHRGGLGLVALEAGPQPGLRPSPGAGEGLPRRLRRRAPGHRRAAGLDPSPAGRGTAGRGGRRLPPLRPPRRGQVQGEQRQAGGPPDEPPPRRSGPVRQAQRPGHPRGGRPVAPAGRGGRDAPGGALRRQGAAALGQGSAGRRAGGRHHRGQAPAHPLPRGPAAPPPPLRGPHPHGQVHPDAPHRRPQDAGEGGRKGRRRHRRNRPPRRPGGRVAPSGAGVPGGQGEADRPGRPDPRPRHQPAGHPRLRRPRPHRRLGGARGPGPVGAVGAEDAVHPGADGQDPPRGQRAPRYRPGQPAHHPGRAEAPVG